MLSNEEKLNDYKEKLKCNGFGSNDLLEKTILELKIKRKASLDSQLKNRYKLTIPTSGEFEQKEETKDM